MEEQRQELELDLGTLLWNFFKGLKKTWWLIPALAVLGAVLGYGKTSGFYVPMYQSTASFTVLTGSTNESTGGESYNFYYDSQTAGQLARTFPYILSSNLLTDAIKEDLGVDTINGSISAQAVSDSNLITMTVTSNNPQDAKAILESAIRVYPDVSRFVIGETRFNMIDEPTMPTEPSNSPNYVRQTQKWASFGAAAGIMLIVIFAILRKTVQKPEELKAVMSLECLGNVPEVRFKARTGKNHPKISFFNDRVPQAFKESILSLEVRLEREMEEKNGKILLVTSTVAQEGKTTAALNLAFAAASHGKKVLYIDGDLRKQKTRQDITSEAGFGLADVILGKAPFEKAAVFDKNSGIWMLCGSHPSNQIPRILNNSRMEEIMERCKKNADLVIIDTPPCELFEDAGIFAEYADAILYVIRHDYVQRRRIVDGISSMEDTGVPVLGYAFNAIPVHHGGYGYYGYGRYGYGYYGYGKYGYGKYGYGKTASEKAQRDKESDAGKNDGQIE